jgi:hypothetical protein
MAQDLRTSHMANAMTEQKPHFLFLDEGTGLPNTSASTFQSLFGDGSNKNRILWISADGMVPRISTLESLL